MTAPEAAWSSPLLLASASPRRSALLARIGIPHEVRPVSTVEERIPGESALEAVCRIAREKAHAARTRDAGRCLLTADTGVIVDDVLLGKPKDADEARAMLEQLSGRWHEVVTALCLVDSDGTLHELHSVTRVRFAALTEAEISAYLATDEPWDKAGAYAIQGTAGWFVESIEGSASNVVGLPYDALRGLLARAGLPAPPLAPAR